MKILNYLTILFLLGIMITSCQKEEIETDNVNLIDSVVLRNSSPSDCGYIKELCMPCEDELLEKEDAIFVDFFGFTDNDDNDKNKFKINSVQMFSESDEYLVTAPDGKSYILSNTTNKYIIRKSKNTPIPKGIKNIFRLDQSKLESNSYIEALMSQDLGASVARNSDNVIIINSNLLGNDDDIQARIYDPCEMQFMKTMELYLEKLNMPDIITTSTSTWMSVVEPVFKNCTDSINLDEECADTRCIIDGLINLESFNWNSDQLKHLRTNYLSLLLNLNDSESNSLANEPSEFITDLYNIVDCNGISFCNGEKNPVSFIESILKNRMEQGDNLQISLVLDDLSDQADWIVETETFKNCNLLKCLFDHVRNQEGDLWCDIFDQFDSSYRDLILDVGGDNFTPDPFEQNPSRNGVTGLNNDGVLSITFNPSLCEGGENVDTLRILKTIIHEGLHADLWQYVSDNLLPGQTLSSIDQTTFNEVFNSLFEILCDETILTDQHQVMMNNSIETIASALHSLNNNIGEIEDYYYLAWLGIWREDDCVESVISNDSINVLRDKYEMNVQLSPTISCE